MTTQAYQVLKEFNPNYYYHLKALVLLSNKYGFNWLKRFDVHNKIYYGFNKACRECNIYDKDQLMCLRKMKYYELKNIHININEYLNTAQKEAELN